VARLVRILFCEFSGFFCYGFYVVLDTPAKLGKIVIGMNKALGEIPVTVKLRTGVKDGRNTAHKIMPRLSTDWNAGFITVGPSITYHGLLMLISCNPFSCTVELDSKDTQG
jgi:hypothetical protein